MLSQILSDTFTRCTHSSLALAPACRAYDVEAVDGVAYRGSFLIDRSGIVRHQVVNDLPLGRNIDEMLRMIDALQFTEEHGEVCPAGWSKGKAPEDTRKVLESLAPYSDWEELTVLLINLGQTLCGPLPQCGKCPLKSYCTYAREVASSGIIIKEKKKAKLKKESNP